MRRLVATVCERCCRPLERQDQPTNPKDPALCRTCLAENQTMPRWRKRR